ncbi:hypothetical protein CIB48_g8344 [Xylaria polymorpha]|nr:hypothetical protein CIB48_g8344 [Xylaria polymorpha]
MAAIEGSALLKKLNVGVVDIGRIGREHAKNLLHKELSPYGVQVVKTFEELIETPGLDAKTKVMVAFVRRFDADYKEASAAIQRG